MGKTIGWSAYEKIGVSLINPRGIHGMGALNRITLTHKSTTIIIRENFITIDGVMEEAAMALAEHILNDLKKEANAGIKYFTYISIEAYLIDGKVLINQKQDVLDAKRWDLLKKETEKICNTLKAFM